MTIVFPALQAWNGTTTSMSFPADVDGKRISCRISVEALQDGFDPHGVPQTIFEQHRHEIEAKAEQLIAQGRFEQDGSILIRSADM